MRVTDRIETRAVGIVGTTLSALQVLTKLAALQSRLAFRVPTSTSSVLPASLHTDCTLTDFSRLAVRVDKATTPLIGLLKAAGKTTCKGRVIGTYGSIHWAVCIRVTSFPAVVSSTTPLI